MQIIKVVGRRWWEGYTGEALIRDGDLPKFIEIDYLPYGLVKDTYYRVGWKVVEDVTVEASKHKMPKKQDWVAIFLIAMFVVGVLLILLITSYKG